MRKEYQKTITKIEKTLKENKSLNEGLTTKEQEMLSATIKHIEKAIELLKMINRGKKYTDYIDIAKDLSNILSSDHGEAGLKALATKEFKELLRKGN